VSLITHDELEQFADQLRADAVGEISSHLAFGVFAALSTYAKDCPELGVEILSKASRAYLEACRHVHGREDAVEYGEGLLTNIDDSVTDIQNNDGDAAHFSAQTIQSILVAFEEYKR
jgi:hypothetical protein